ncbi:MAG: energy-coupling factor transporter transmembrane component T [Nitratireductor sp.]
MLSWLHPLPKLAVALAFLLASILVFDLVFQIALSLGMVLVLIVFERVPVWKVLLLCVPFALFGFGFLTTSLLFRQEAGVALDAAGQSLWHALPFSAGLTLFFRALAGGLVSMAFALTTDPGQLVRALMACRLLPPRFAYALFSALELVPDLAGAANEIRLARAMRTGRRPRRIPGPVEIGALVVPLLAFAVRRAGRAAIAMEARGLAAGGARTIINLPRLSRRDAVFVGLAGLVLAMLVAGARTGWSLSALAGAA